MYKTKTNKVIASLTELKNKTGDILALADEFGEVTLTSYNRPRYKVIRIEMEEVVDLDSEAPKKKVKVSAKPKIKEELEAEVPVEEIKKSEVEVAVPAKVEVVAQPETKPEEPADAIEDELSKMQPWDRHNEKEKEFINKSLLPLITN